MILKVLSTTEPFTILNDEEQELFLSKFSPLSLHKDDYFIREGQLNRLIGFIVKGCMMCSFNKNGKDHIEEFSFENEFISDYRNLLTGSVSDKNIICLEDTELYVVNFEHLKLMYDHNPIFDRVGRLIAEALFMNWQEKAKSFLIDDAEERYMKLLQSKPNLLQRVPQYLVASYLGVNPETLSRIRKKISLKKRS